MATNPLTSPGASGVETSDRQPRHPGPHDGPGIVRVTHEVLDGEPVLLIAHHGDGHWRVAGRHGDDEPTGPASLAAAGGVESWTELVAADPTLEHTESLLPGWAARRDSPESPWRRTPQ